MNLKYKKPRHIPIFFHNLAKNDCSLFIKKLRGKINCVPKNDEEYISFSKRLLVNTFTNKKGKECILTKKLRFIDSFKFMATSLEALANNLKKEQFRNLKKYYKEDRKFGLLRRKGVFPYDYVDCFEKLAERYYR